MAILSTEGQVTDMGWMTLYNLGDDEDADAQNGRGGWNNPDSGISDEQYRSMQSVSRQHGTKGQKPKKGFLEALIFGEDKTETPPPKKKGFFDGLF